MSEMDEVRAQLAAMQIELRRLADIMEITQIITQYGPNVDSGSAQATAELWTPDGTFAVVGDGRW